jgi:malate dehydrogenase (oxaloacetate-decarboxylating)
MFIKAADVLSDHSPMLKDPSAALFPPFEELRSISRKIAIAISKLAEEEGLVPKSSESAIISKVDSHMWVPNYPLYSKKTELL